MCCVHYSELHELKLSLLILLELQLTLGLSGSVQVVLNMADIDIPFEVDTVTPGLKVFLSSAGKFYVATYEGFRNSYVKKSGNEHVFKCSPGEKLFGRCPGKLFLDLTFTRVLDGPADDGVSRTHTHSPNQRKCIERYEYYKTVNKNRTRSMEHKGKRVAFRPPAARRATVGVEEKCSGTTLSAADEPAKSTVPGVATNIQQNQETSVTATPSSPILEVNITAPPTATKSTMQEPGKSNESGPENENRRTVGAVTVTPKPPLASQGSSSTFKNINIHVNQIRRTSQGATTNTRALLNDRDFKILEHVNSSLKTIAEAFVHLSDNVLDQSEALQHLVVSDDQKFEQLEEIGKTLGAVVENMKIQTGLKKRKLELLEEIVVLKKKKQASLEEIVAIKTLKLKRELASLVGNKKT